MKICKTRLRKELRRLVRIPSHEEVDTIADYVLNQLRDAGLDSAHRDEDGNVIAVHGDGEGLLLNAHLDTVGVQGFDGDPYAGRIDGDRLIGRGACDCKSGCATLLELARLLPRRPLHRKMVFAFTIWEEGSAPGPNGAFGAARRIDAADAIVLESTVRLPSRMDVLVGCRGILRMDLVVKGKATHSSTPERGDNALYRAADFVRRFRDVLSPESMPRAEFNLLGRTFDLPCVATLTEIQANQGRNIIPDRCTVGLDCRLFPGQDASEMVRRIEILAGEFGRGKVAIESIRHIAGHVCEKADVVAACREAAGKNGFRSRIDVSSGRTDSTIFQNEGGIPSVVFGPGQVGEGHTKNEGIHLPSFYSAAQVCLDTVCSLAEGDRT